MGAKGKMLLTELCCQEFTGLLLMHGVFASVQVGIPLNAPSKIHNSLGFCAREEDRAISECCCSLLSVAVGTPNYFQMWGDLKQLPALERLLRGLCRRCGERRHLVL